MRAALIAGLLLFAGCEPDGVTRDWHRVDPPAPAPSFALKRLDGSSVSLAELKGQVVLVEFWATWCGPCRSSLPSLEVMATRYRDQGVRVLLVNVAEGPEPVRAWLEDRYTASFVLLDRDGRIADQYGVAGIPRLFVIDQQGRIAWLHQGYGGGLERNLTMILDELLGAHG